MEVEPFSNSTVVFEMIGFLVSLTACALFSFLETSVTALRLFSLKEIQTKTKRYRNLFKTLETNPHMVLVTILIANSVANVTAAALITNITEKVFAQFNLSSGLGFSLGIAVGAILILIFGEVIPKNIAKLKGEKLFRSTLWITNIIYYSLYPFVTILIKLSNAVASLFGGAQEPSESFASEREIRFMIDYIDEKGLMDPEKTEMLKSIFKLGSKPVKEIMVPANDVIMVNVSSSIENALKIFSKYQYSRLPVFEKTKDNIIGMVHLKDIFVHLWQKDERTLQDLVRPIMFVPESMKINQLLREFRLQGMHIAVVLNEFGSITGIVTLEDALEEIVGEISDEYEEAPEKIIALDEGGWLVDASIDLETLEEILNIPFESEESISLGGFLTEQLQHLPQKGERILYKGFYFQIQKATPKRVLQVIIFKKEKNTSSD